MRSGTTGTTGTTLYTTPSQKEVYTLKHVYTPLPQGFCVKTVVPVVPTPLKRLYINGYRRDNSQKNGSPLDNSSSPIEVN